MGFKLSDADERKLVGVDPRLVRVVRRVALLVDQPFRVTEGVRTLQRQKQLYKEKKTKTLNSKHLTGRAVDVAPLVNGVPSYDWAQYKRLVAVAKQVAKETETPMAFGYDWGWDAPHWELK